MQTVLPRYRIQQRGPSLNSNRAVAVAVMLESAEPDTKVLLCQRRSDARYALKWEFPGGKVEEGETAEQALQRELFEELCVENTRLHLVHEEQSLYSDGGRFHVSFFVCSSWTGSIQNQVFNDLRWVHVEELLSFDILEGNQNFCSSLRETLDAYFRASLLATKEQS